MGAVICCFILSSIAKAAVRLPAIIGSHMILQQNSNVKIWGWCEPSENIVFTTTYYTTTYYCKGLANAKWTVVVKTPAAGGPFSIINGNNKMELQDVMIGEV